jgi:amidophosphoribosyltransferase
VGAESPREECGVFGIWAPEEQVAKLCYFGIYALQHRGQEAAGMAISDGERVIVYKDTGLVSQVFTESTLSALPGSLGIAHTRYSTTGSSRWENAQPSYRPVAARNSGVALAHNGNLTNTLALADRVREQRLGGMRSTTDSDLVCALLAEHEGTLAEALDAIVPSLQGAFSMVVMDETELFAFRDPAGIRPLSLGRLPAGGWVVASETCAFDILGAEFVRDIEPGEIVRIGADGLSSTIFAKPTPKLCIFEYVYLARPDSILEGVTVHETRREMGRILAEESPVDADLVIGVPQTGPVAAAGFAEVSGVPFGDGLVQNRYVARTFIEPTQTMRQMGIRLKFNPLKSAVRGKRLIVVDDSIVRGNTTRQLVKMLREAGATEVHLRITSPPVRWPCFYGIDMATRTELIATDLGIDEIRAYIGADSLAYLSVEAMVRATGKPSNGFCRACFDGIYPVPIPEGAEDPKSILELIPDHPRVELPSAPTLPIDPA